MASLTGDTMKILSNHCGCAIRGLGLDDREEERPGPVARPAVFFIDTCGIVQFQYIGRRPEDRPMLELLKLAARNMPRHDPGGSP